jgi:8-oxo-dGTP pyrophosphatase MutT (NUDIX family)
MNQQVAALPVVVGDDGIARVLLLTSRKTKRWVIPKGWPMKGLKPHEAAAQEAFEEAGLSGKIGKKRIGRYTYFKRRGEPSGRGKKPRHSNPESFGFWRSQRYA